MTLTRVSLTVLCAAVLCAAGCGGNKKSSGASASAAAPATSASAGATQSSVLATPSSASPGGAVAAPSSAAATRALQLSSVDPSQGPLDGGTLVTVRGSGFQAGSGEVLVLFGTRAVTVQAQQDDELQVTAPGGVQAGLADVRVVSETGAALLPSAWTYGARLPVLSCTPPVGHHELGLGGTVIRLELEHFAPLSSAAQVSFEQTPAASVALLDSRTILVEVPQGLSAGLVEVSVEDQGQVVRAGGFRIQGALAYGDLTVNEFCAHPGGLDFNPDAYGDSKADEFVELVNTTGEWVDLSYLAIFDGADRERHRFLNPTALPPGGAIVVFGGGTPEGFAPRHHSGQAQQAVADELALNNTNDSIELRTMPGLNPSGTVLFRVEYDAPPSGASFVNRADGQAIRTNPATTADYEDHTTAPGSAGRASPGVRNDGTGF